MTDEITLTIPREPGFDRVAHLVVSGLAVRMNLTLENLEDLQIALDALLDRNEGGGDVTVKLSLDDDELGARVGPIAPHVLDELAQRDTSGLGVRRVLDSTVDGVRVDGEWVELTKKVTVRSG
jgi:hypothetical protein